MEDWEISTGVLQVMKSEQQGQEVTRDDGCRLLPGIAT